MLKKIGSWIGTAKRYINQIQEEVSTISENEIVNDKEKYDESKITKGKNDKK